MTSLLHITAPRTVARRLILLGLFGIGVATSAAPAAAAATPVSPQIAPPVLTPPSMSYRPPGFTIDAAQALAIAKTSPVAIAVHRREHPLAIEVRLWGLSRYDVYMFRGNTAVVLVEISRSGHILHTWTGPLIEVEYGRGNYAPLFDSPWVCLPFGLLFLLPFARLRRRPTLAHLDLLMVLGFGVSYFLFNQTHLEAGVWLAYVPLLYLLGRMIVLGMRPGRSRAGLESWVSSRWLLVGLVGLIAARIGLALGEETPIDVGLASIAGAARILHGLPIYYNNPGHPDTYGPINYLLYVPFQLVFPWSGKWDYLAGARAASITFDLLTIGGLVWLGRRLRPSAGWRPGLILGWLWAACPFTLLATMRGTNDEMVSLLLVGVLLCFTSPIGRGVLTGLGAAAKFLPGLLLPLIAVGPRARGREIRVTTAAFVIVSGAAFALFLPPGGVSELWSRTLGYQLTRPDHFSIWGLHPELAPVKDVLIVAAVGLAILFAFWPRGERSLPQVAALMAAVSIAAQLSAVHWFYYYIVWFMPGVFVAIVGLGRRAAGELDEHRDLGCASQLRLDPSPKPEPVEVLA